MSLRRSFNEARHRLYLISTRHDTSLRRPAPSETTGSKKKRGTSRAGGKKTSWRLHGARGPPRRRPVVSSSMRARRRFVYIICARYCTYTSGSPITTYSRIHTHPHALKKIISRTLYYYHYRRRRPRRRRRRRPRGGGRRRRRRWKVRRLVRRPRARRRRRDDDQRRRGRRGRREGIGGRRIRAGGG